MMPSKKVKDPSERRGKSPGSAKQHFKKGVVQTHRRPTTKGLAKMIGIRSTGGQEFIDFAFAIFRNEHPDLMPTFAQRWDAMTLLMDRGFGKAPVVIEQTVDVADKVIDVVAMQTLSDEMLDQLAELDVFNELPPGEEVPDND